jgi:hypothetical protein
MCLVLDWITLDLEVHIELSGSFADCSEAVKEKIKNLFLTSLLFHSPVKRR